MAEFDASDLSRRNDLARSEEKFRLLVESVVDYAIFMLDPDGMVSTWNVGAERLKGYRSEEIVGQHYSVFYPPEHRDAGLPDRLLSEAREQGRATHSGWRVRRDGTRFWADVVITALHKRPGELAGFAKVTRDMTDAHLAEEARDRALAEQRAAVARLEELDRWRVEFMGAIVHDLQNPVTSITGFTELLLADDADRDDEATRRLYLDQLRSNARSLQELIANLRAHTRLAEHRAVLNRETFDLAPFVTGLIRDLAPVLGDRAVDTEVDDLEITADRQALERVLRNLLGNAGRHTPPESTVRVRARARDAVVVFEVHDDGPGIPTDLLPRIFERFQRGEPGGTGLGLAIAKQYVELHGGKIAVHSPAEGGAEFTFTIPQQGAGRSAG